MKVKGDCMLRKEYLKNDAISLSKMVKDGETTAIELVNLSFEQMKLANPLLNAVVHERQHEALNEAEVINRGVFQGVPILMKNIGQTIMGEPITSGAELLKSYKAHGDSNFVKKFREAGFVFTGYTNTPEFALKNITEPVLHGVTRNPWHKDFSPGGSSGGAAAAVASGIVPVAGASDGGGSIRIPASFTSLFGLKPTRGRTPVGPGVGREWQGAAINFVLSRSVRDSAAMLDALQVVQPEAAFQTPLFLGRYVNRMYEELEPMHIGFSTTSPVGTPVSNEAKEAVYKLVSYLENLGHHVEEKDPDVDGKQIMRNYYLMNSGEMATSLRQLERGLGRDIRSDEVELESWMLKEAGKSVSAMDFSDSLASWDTAASQMHDYHQTYDLFITPTTADSAPKIGELTPTTADKARMIEAMEKANAGEKQELIWDMFLPSLTYSPFTQLANLTGQPAMSLPIHITKAGLPLGVQVMAEKGREDLLLQLAKQVEDSPLWVGMKGNPYFVEEN